MSKICIIRPMELRPGNKTIQNYGFKTYGGKDFEIVRFNALHDFNSMVEALETPNFGVWDDPDDDIVYVKRLDLYEATDNDGIIDNEKLILRYWKDRK